MRFDTLGGWLSWQEQLHPSTIELGLDRVSQVYRRLAAATRQAVVITIAGTNGKGSSAAMLDAVYRAAGYRVGRYSSPHLQRYTERVAINGEEVSEQALCEAFDRIDQARGELSLTYFEFGTLAALDLFNRATLDVVVLEVGMGGRLDAVNIIDPDVALITNIGLDHQAWLGDDRESIGFEKAGIMRAGQPVVFGESALPASVLGHATAVGATLLRYGVDYGVLRQNPLCWDWFGPQTTREALPWPALRASVQLNNAANILMVIELLRDRLPVAQQHLRDGLLGVRLPGRMQLLPGRPLRILDVAHNAESVAALATSLRALPSVAGRTLAVVGMLADKDAATALALIAPQVDGWYFGTLGGERGRESGTLAQAVSSPAIACYDSVAEAYQAALAEASADDRIVVFGSFYTVAEVMALEKACEAVD